MAKMTFLPKPGAHPSPPPVDHVVWMYFETDGDAGYYEIELFTDKAKAEAHQQKKQSAYGNITEIGVR